MKKILVVVAAVLISASWALAGFDMYTGKRFTTIIAPTVLTVGQTTTNSTITGVDCAGVPGVAALIVGANCKSWASDTLTVTIQSCATTNGTYSTVTNGNGAAMAFTFAYTNIYYVTNIVPNAQNRYWRAVVAAGATTSNAEAGVLLVTE